MILPDHIVISNHLYKTHLNHIMMEYLRELLIGQISLYYMKSLTQIPKNLSSNIEINMFKIAKVYYNITRC